MSVTYPRSLTLHSSPSIPCPLSTMSSHLESHRSLCSINHKSDLILKSFRESRCWCHRDHWWHVTLWSKLRVQHQPGLRAPGLWRGPSGCIPTSQALQCILFSDYFLEIIIWRCNHLRWGLLTSRRRTRAASLTWSTLRTNPSWPSWQPLGQWPALSSIRQSWTQARRGGGGDLKVVN